HRYPCMPNRGMARKTPAIRTSSPATLIRKVKNVFPRPLMALIRAVLVYRNGQIHARVRMNFPAALLWKRTAPIRLPKIRKNRQHPRPRMKQLPTAFFRSFTIAVWFPAAWVALTAGISTVPTEFVIAEGKRMHGIAMPLSTPYVLRASLQVIQKSCTQAGIEAASTLCSRVTAARLAIRGDDRLKSSLTVPDSEGRDGIRPKGFWAASRRAEKRAAMNSPATIPAAASWIEGV